MQDNTLLNIVEKPMGQMQDNTLLNIVEKPMGQMQDNTLLNIVEKPMGQMQDNTLLNIVEQPTAKPIEDAIRKAAGPEQPKGANLSTVLGLAADSPMVALMEMAMKEIGNAMKSAGISNAGMPTGGGNGPANTMVAAAQGADKGEGRA